MTKQIGTLTLSDLMLLTEQEFVDSVTQDYKLEGRVFIRRLFLSEQLPPRNLKDKVLDNGTRLALSEVVKPSILYKMKEPGWLYINQIVDFAVPWDFKQISYLDLSWCDLLDDDIKYLVKIVDKMPRLEILDLCGNRIYSGRPEELSQLIYLVSKCVFVDLSTNGVATSPAMLTYVQNGNFWSKYIWIYEPHFEGRGWETMLIDMGYSSLVSLVELAHKSYYKKNKRQK